MQETEFIQQNKDKWQEFEEILKSKHKDPERLTDLFIETTDDLSYSRTYYPNRSVRVYLNGISQLIYQAIYKNRRGEKNVIRKFWFEDLPDAMWRSRKALLLSFSLFVAGLIVGIVSSIYYPDFARIMLGDSYVEMTEANISNGDPMAVYKDDAPVMMFLQIAFNNIKIAFGTFALGLLFGIGTMYVVFYNAIMVGAFVYFFIERGLFRESFFTIMLHGTLELSMIVMAGCAGFMLARGLVFPGTYTRMQALVHSSRTGIKILLGVTALLLYAAFIESFVTRYTDLSDLMRALIILLSMGVVLTYFVIYPAIRHRKGLTAPEKNEDMAASTWRNFDLTQIQDLGKIFNESFVLLSSGIARICGISAAAAVAALLYFGYLHDFKYNEIEFSGFNAETFLYSWYVFHPYLDVLQHPQTAVALTLLLTTAGILYLGLADKAAQRNDKINWKTWLRLLMIPLLFCLLLLPSSGLSFVLIILLSPYFHLWFFTTYESGQSTLESAGIAWRLAKGNFSRLYGIFLSLLVIQWILLFILSTNLIGFVIEFITFNLPHSSYLAENAFMIFFTFFAFMVAGIIISLHFFAFARLYHSLKEINEAATLRRKIQNIGFKKRAYGLEQE